MLVHRHALLFPGVRDQRATAVADVGVVPQRGLRGLQLLQRESHHLDGRLKGYGASWGTGGERSTIFFGWLQLWPWLPVITGYFYGMTNIL